MQSNEQKKALKKQYNDKPKNSRSQNVVPQVPKGMLSMNSQYKADKNAKLSETDTTDITHYNLNYSNRLQHQLQIEHIDLNSFKVQPCKIQGTHSHKHCPFYHNQKDKKRVGIQYSAEMCTQVERNQNCPYQDNCHKAHNRVEQLYRLDNYKTKFCSFYPNNLQQCDYGKFCSFAHSEEDIVIELIHNLDYDDDFFMFYYKTVWCPFNLTSHDKALCVYAHNWQDFRRKPHIYQYNPIPCQNWKTADFITEYHNGCADSFNCMKCHGWKELEYHPMLFRTKQCINQNCNKNDCSFFHNQQERRQIDQLSQYRVFKIVPRNRIIQNTFKTRDSSSQRSDKYTRSQEIPRHTTGDGQSQWLGGHNLQNSFYMDQDSDVSDMKQQSQTKKGNYQSTLVCIQERTDSDELKELMRKKSLSYMDDKLDADNEHVINTDIQQI
ncbi:hypothetical protein pb186bvf_019237 [Paramecium bursaria]